MRFCPYCAAENLDESTHCASCARRMQAVVARRQTAVLQNPVDEDAQTTIAPRPEPITVVPTVTRKTSSSSSSSPLRLNNAPVSTPPVAPAPEPLPPPPTKIEPPPIAPTVPVEATPPVRTASNGTPARVPTPTRISAPPEAWKPLSKLTPMPEVPEAGLFAYARYTLLFGRARFDRRKAVRSLELDIKGDVASLDGLLGALGKEARKARIEHRAFTEENKQINLAEQRRFATEKACADLTSRKAEENIKYEQIQKELGEKLVKREAASQAAAKELERLDGQRRALKDKRKEVDRQIRAHTKAADDRDGQAAKSQMSDARQALRKSAEEMRREARKLEPQRDELDVQLSAIEGPYQTAVTKSQQSRSDLESAKAAVEDAREGHRHRLAEIEAEQGHKSRELAQADAEIARHLITLGTLVNLNRFEHPACDALYKQIDDLKSGIAAREHEIDRLNAERAAYDSASLLRGGAVLGGAVILVVTLICVLIAIL
jgi:hypothetical protein